MANSIKLVHAALDEIADRIVLRGVVDPGSLNLLQVDDYQRDIVTRGKIEELAVAARGSKLPDIELGMRGQKYTTRDDNFYLQDDVFIIDGLQRVTACKLLLQREPTAEPRLGALIHFDTTKDWERERFRILNMDRTKLSPNVLLRNLRPDYSVLDTLFNLCEDKSFVVRGRVCWTQRQRREDLLTALTLLKVIGRLHGHLGPGRSNHLLDLSKGTQKIIEKVGRNTFRENVRTFFDVIDRCWGVQRVAFREGASYIKSTFMVCLADIFSNHYDFWRGDDETKLFVDANIVRKLALFPVADPSVAQLASAGGKAGEVLYAMILKHLNSGKRSKKLRSRNAIGLEISPPSDDDGNGMEDGSECETEESVNV